MNGSDGMPPARARSGAACGFAPRPSLAACVERRQRLATAMGEDVLILGGGSLRIRSNDSHFRFRPDSDFYYLTGLAEPGGVMVFRPGRDPSLTLFVRPRDQDAETWSGRRLGPEGALAAFGADAAYPLAALADRLPDLLDGATRVIAPLENARVMRRVHRALANLRRRNRAGTRPPSVLADARTFVGEDRVLKDAAALASLRRATDLTVAGHVAAMRACRPGMFEYELEALLEYQFRCRGGSGPGYGSIVGSGDNATILHYVDNDARLAAGQLVLIDAGAEWDLHSGDCTRTFPVDGRFSPAQRDLYQVVLRANEQGIALASVGSTMDAIHERCVEVLCEGLLELGLLAGTLEQVRADESYKRFYMHKTGHWLGADVHDAGHYCIDRTPRPLQAGFVLTVEPGLYIRSDDDTVAPEFRGIGIRIEDDVLVRTDGPEILTHGAPKTVDALEAEVGAGPSSLARPQPR